MKTLNDLRDAAHAMAREKGWYDGGARNIGELLMLVVTEAAEAMEEYRIANGPSISETRYEYPRGRPPVSLSQHRRLFAQGAAKPVGFPSELADILIRCFDLAGYLGIDLDEAVRVKMAHNATRPHRHGGKRA